MCGGAQREISYPCNVQILVDWQKSNRTSPGNLLPGSQHYRQWFSPAVYNSFCSSGKEHCYFILTLCKFNYQQKFIYGSNFRQEALLPNRSWKESMRMHLRQADNLLSNLEKCSYSNTSCTWSVMLQQTLHLPLQGAWDKVALWTSEEWISQLLHDSHLSLKVASTGYLLLD